MGEKLANSSSLDSTNQALDQTQKGTEGSRQRRQGRSTKKQLSFDLGAENVKSEGIGLVLPSWPYLITRCLQVLGTRLQRVLRPRLRPGYCRIKWLCDCGRNLYADFDNTYPKTVEALASELQSQTKTQNEGTSSTSNQSSNAVTSEDRHSASGSSSSSSNSTSESFDSSQQLTSQGLSLSLGDSNASCCSRFTSTLKPTYLELCMNTGEFTVNLGEVNIRQVTTDYELFQKIWEKYREVRGYRMRMIYLKPCEIQYVYVSVPCALFHAVFPPICLLGNLLISFTHSLVSNQPTSSESTENPTRSPPEAEVKAQRYHYYECPLASKPSMPSHLFLHYLNCAARAATAAAKSQYQKTNPSSEPESNPSPAPPIFHKSATFLNRLPKKTGCSIFHDPHNSNNSDADQIYGWGIHIIEGSNKTAMGWTLVVGVIA